MNKKKSIIVGIAGASGSGKSFFAQKLRNALRNRNVLILSQDFYYKDRSSIPLEERAHINYDHPNAIDFDLLAEHLRQLKSGKAIRHPQYDFTVHNRKKEWVEAGPADVVLLDGILIYVPESLHSLIDFKVFIDTPMDVCFIRRLQRDTRERGRTMASVIEQYLKTVRPMYLKYVLPSKKVADLVIVGEGTMEASARYVLNHLEEIDS